MNSEKITQKCYANLVEEASFIKKRLLLEIKKRIIEARRQGDYSENGELQSELKAKVEAENRLEKVEKTIHSAEVIDVSDVVDKDLVQFGASVSLEILRNGETSNVTYHIVGLIETDIQAYKIYYKSPIAKLMIGKRVGNEYELNGIKYKITNISYANISS